MMAVVISLQNNSIIYAEDTRLKEEIGEGSVISSSDRARAVNSCSSSVFTNTQRTYPADDQVLQFTDVILAQAHINAEPPGSVLKHIRF